MKRSFEDMRNLLKYDPYFIKDTSFLNPRAIYSYRGQSLYRELNPWNPDLTTEEQKEIIERCKENVWYFLRDVVRINNYDQEELQPFYLDISTISMIYLYEKQKSCVLLATRQITGKSILLYALYIHSLIRENLSPDIPFIFYPNKENKYSVMNRIKLPGFFIRYLNNKTVSHIKDMNEKAYDIAVLEKIKQSVDKPTIYFLDDLMFNKRINPDQFYGTVYAVSTIGSYNADFIANTIPFHYNMMNKNIEQFTQQFEDFIGYKPVFLINPDFYQLASKEEVELLQSLFQRKDDISFIENGLKNYIEKLDDDDLYRKEILVKPRWSL